MANMKSFTWGTAAASYQVEGRLPDDGRGKCVWDMLCEQPGKVRGGHNGDNGCMHIEHALSDAQLMQSLGLDAYRLSISWPRVLPQGTGQINTKGIAFYDKLIDDLLAHDVTPWVTLFHWDYPYALFQRGGWLNPDSSDWFADYTRIIVDKLSDRVQHWFTLNEPQCFIHFGHHTGMHAPGLQLGFGEVLTAAHNALLAHGKAAQIIRQDSVKKSFIGAAPVGNVVVPKQHNEKLIALARDKTFAITQKDTWSNSWFADPMILGHYPEDGLALFEQHMPDIGVNDMSTICQPLDFYGANIYTASSVDINVEGEMTESAPEDGRGYTSMDWLVEPECLYWASKFFYERYQLPMVITENGMANNDWVDRNGQVEDPQRIDYLARHIEQFQRAGKDGVETLGYFAWSIMDNFEWQWGYDRRFGLVYVDYQTQERIPKSSAYWYRDFIQTHKKTASN